MHNKLKGEGGGGKGFLLHKELLWSIFEGIFFHSFSWATKEDTVWLKMLERIERVDSIPILHSSTKILYFFFVLSFA